VTDDRNDWNASAPDPFAGTLDPAVSAGRTPAVAATPKPDESEPQPEPSGPDECPWCSATVPEGATHCPSCQAALVESPAVANLEIPGVTEVDPGVIADEAAARRAFKRAKAQSTHVLGPTLGIIGGGSIGHIVGNAIEDLLSARASGPSSDVNEMGPFDLMALERRPAFGAGEDEDDAEPAPPSSQLPDPWVDLPPPSLEDQIDGTEFDPWATADHGAHPELDPWATPAIPDATTSPADDPWAPAPNDPWAVGDGPWSQDPWGNASDPAKDPDKPR
jgi:hypothetical protein